MNTSIFFKPHNQHKLVSKRRLKKIGFQLQFLKHPHKREMIRAIKV